jgi:hypothetical protein
VPHPTGGRPFSKAAGPIGQRDLPLIEFQQSLHLDGSNTGDGGFARLEYLFKKVGGRLRVLLVSSSLKHIVRV